LRSHPRPSDASRAALRPQKPLHADDDSERVEAEVGSLCAGVGDVMVAGLDDGSGIALASQTDTRAVEKLAVEHPIDLDDIERRPHETRTAGDVGQHATRAAEVIAAADAGQATGEFSGWRVVDKKRRFAKQLKPVQNEPPQSGLKRDEVDVAARLAVAGDAVLPRRSPAARKRTRPDTAFCLVVGGQRNLGNRDDERDEDDECQRADLHVVDCTS
jgi:hypothetical protein